MRESQVEKALVRRVKLLGGKIRKVAWVGRRGAPDRFVMLPPAASQRLHFPRSIWVELKRSGLDAEDHQAREHTRMRNCGEIVLVIDTLDLLDRWFPLESIAP